MKYTISKRFRFEAAHSLPHLHEGHKCRNVHGHSYEVEFFCEGDALDDRGFLVDYADISKSVGIYIDFLDHKNLNDVFDFPTTAENIASHLLLKFKNAMPLKAVEIRETPTTIARVEL